MPYLSDYYEALNISRFATQDEIRRAYKREALRSHPDGLSNAIWAEKRKGRKRFQEVANAYSVLSDPIQRQEYRARRGLFKRLFSRIFRRSRRIDYPQVDAEKVFVDVFAELLRPEIERYSRSWTFLGAMAGAGLGYIMDDSRGLARGAAIGSALGAIRDANGKSVAETFSELREDQKAEILRALAKQ
ncbi:DnaJ domain-containing protein [Mycena capillaripes]|nr:DnaJ domain-containing protein [Mycena capillaripes]